MELAKRMKSLTPIDARPDKTAGRNESVTPLLKTAIL